MNIIKEERVCKQTKVKILTDNKKYVSIAYKEIVKQREALERHIAKQPEFLSSLVPLKLPPSAPKIAKIMEEGADIADVGPMAAVAGTIAELAARKMMSAGAKVAIVENGGDIFAYSEIPLNIGLFADVKELEELAFRIMPEDTPFSVCSSSSFLGHSLSFGKCDLATVFSKKGTIADAAATAVGNKVKSEEDIEKTLSWAIKLEGVDGVMIVKGKNVGMIGKLPQIVSHKDRKLKDKIAKDHVYRL